VIISGIKKKNGCDSSNKDGFYAEMDELLQIYKDIIPDNADISLILYLII